MNARLERDAHDRRDQRHHLGQPDSGAVRVAGQLVQEPDLPIGRAGRPDRPDARESPGPRPRPAPRPGSAPAGSASGSDRRARSPPTAARTTTSSVMPSSSGSDQGHGDDRTDEDHHTGHGVDQTGGHDRAQQGGVRADPGHQIAGAAGVVLADRQPQQPLQSASAGCRRTTASAVRCNRYCCSPDSTAPPITKPTSSSTAPPSGRDSLTPVMIMETTAGWARNRPAETSETTTTTPSTRQCGRRYGQRARSGARLPAGAGSSRPERSLLGALSQSKGPAPACPPPSSSVPLVHGLPADP